MSAELGSSPRVWGQASDNLRRLSLLRIIPTRVGTRKGNRNQTQTGLGSSPRVWGQVNSAKQHPPIVGIIPTRVGTSSKRRIQGTQAQDHPHACGDKSPNVCNCPSATGSSPRVWGQVLMPKYPLSPLGIIPTRMGTRRVGIFRV